MDSPSSSKSPIVQTRPFGVENRSSSESPSTAASSAAAAAKAAAAMEPHVSSKESNPSFMLEERVGPEERPLMDFSSSTHPSIEILDPRSATPSPVDRTISGRPSTPCAGAFRGQHFLRSMFKLVECSFWKACNKELLVVVLSAVFPIAREGTNVYLSNPYFELRLGVLTWHVIFNIKCV